MQRAAPIPSAAGTLLMPPSSSRSLVHRRTAIRHFPCMKGSRALHRADDLRRLPVRRRMRLRRVPPLRRPGQAVDWRPCASARRSAGSGERDQWSSRQFSLASRKGADMVAAIAASLASRPHERRPMVFMADRSIASVNPDGVVDLATIVGPVPLTSLPQRGRWPADVRRKAGCDAGIERRATGPN